MSVVSLPMYDLPELRHATNSWWNLMMARYWSYLTSRDVHDVSPSSSSVLPEMSRQCDMAVRSVGLGRLLARSTFGSLGSVARAG